MSDGGTRYVRIELGNVHCNIAHIVNNNLITVNVRSLCI